MFNSIFLQINLTNQRISMFKLLFYINPFISFLFHTASSDCCIFSSWSYYLHLCVFDRFSNYFFLFQIKVWFSSWLIIFLTPMGKINGNVWPLMHSIQSIPFNVIPIELPSKPVQFKFTLKFQANPLIQIFGNNIHIKYWISKCIEVLNATAHWCDTV